MPVSIATKFEELKAATAEQWRGWAESIAEGGASPTPTAVLDAGAILELPTPMAALEADAKAIAEAAVLEARIARSVASSEANLAPYGGTVAAVQERINQLREELRAAQAAIAAGQGWDAGLYRGELSRLKAKNPRAFATEPAPVKKAKARA